MCLAVLCCCATLATYAFDANHFATTSRLASGKWVKIAIPSSGVYQLTYDELRAMGFDNPGDVRVYGWGGNMMSETMASSLPDDLPPVPVMRQGDKVCFYANGPVGFSYSPSATISGSVVAQRFTRQVNPYSSAGYYLLGETGGDELTVECIDNSGALTINDVNTSNNLWYHERDLMTFGSGRELLGEDLEQGDLTFDVKLPNVVTDQTLRVTVSEGGVVSGMGYVRAYLTFGGTRTSVSFPTALSRMYALSNPSHDYYWPTTAIGTSARTSLTENGTIQVGYNPNSNSVTTLKLDYFIITYLQDNLLANHADGQLLMGFGNQAEDDRILLPDASENVVVWNIDDVNKPVAYTTTDFDGGRSFIPGFDASETMYVAFDPTQELKSIGGYEEVANQNIHGEQVPDLLILAPEAYLEQAERLAQLHRDVDGIDVLVLNDKLVFNEFSSGTPDAMAYRLLCKMFYDRDAAKFKNLLLFGPGTIDNRGLIGDMPNKLLTYESANSSEVNYSFASDDFYGQLDENTLAVPRALLRIGVGRINSANADEARSDVDKIVEYYLNPDFGEWRNNAVICADEGDDDLHTFQAEGINNLINPDTYTDPLHASLQTNMNTDKVYNPMFEKASSGVAVEGKRHWTDVFKKGTYFATYVGHSDPSNFTLDSYMWTTSDVLNTEYDHFPIMTTACCDAAPYDNGTVGIADRMFHKRNGGAIALLTSTRQVYASPNHKLNVAFTKALFSYANTGKMVTLGEAYKVAKQYNGTSSDINKMQFWLLGDPALRINYPKPFFNITAVNGTAISANGSLEIKPLEEVTIEARVNKADGTTLDDEFEGDATITLYDDLTLYKLSEKNYEINDLRYQRNIYYPREALAQAKGRVSGGVFTGTLVVPRYVRGGRAMLRAYAHRDDSRDMVNGSLDTQFTLNLTEYDGENIVVDDQPPVVTAMFINDASFDESTLVPSNSTLYITAEDDIAINTQSLSITGTMSLLLDGGKQTYTYVRDYAELTDNGRTVNVRFPLSGLSQGPHTLTYTVFDATGNMANRTINFVVGQPSTGTLQVANRLAIDEAEFDFTTDLTTQPAVTVKVTDATGNVVWSDSTASFPLTWDLVGNDGKRVPAGLYNFFGTYNDGNNYGGTNIGKLIVVEPVKQSN